jgi:hypothetical protein
MAGSTVFHPHLPKEVVELRFVFQGVANVAKEALGRSHCLELNNTVECLRRTQRVSNKRRCYSTLRGIKSCETYHVETPKGGEG